VSQGVHAPPHLVHAVSLYCITTRNTCSGMFGTLTHAQKTGKFLKVRVRVTHKWASSSDVTCKQTIWMPV